MISFLSRLFLLCIGHAFGDLVFQTSYIAENKNRNKPGAQKGLWIFTLTGHALVHAGMVILVTGNIYLGAAEFIAHWVIDFGKCEKWYGLKLDQTLHFLCKVVYAL